MTFSSARYSAASATPARGLPARLATCLDHPGGQLSWSRPRQVRIERQPGCHGKWLDHPGMQLSCPRTWFDHAGKELSCSDRMVEQRQGTSQLLSETGRSRQEGVLAALRDGLRTPDGLPARFRDGSRTVDGCRAAVEDCPRRRTGWPPAPGRWWSRAGPGDLRGRPSQRHVTSPLRASPCCRGLPARGPEPRRGPKRPLHPSSRVGRRPFPARSPDCHRPSTTPPRPPTAS